MGCKMLGDLLVSQEMNDMKEGVQVIGMEPALTGGHSLERECIVYWGCPSKDKFC